MYLFPNYFAQLLFFSNFNFWIFRNEIIWKLNFKLFVISCFYDDIQFWIFSSDSEMFRCEILWWQRKILNRNYVWEWSWKLAKWQKNLWKLQWWSHGTNLNNLLFDTYDFFRNVKTWTRHELLILEACQFWTLLMIKTGNFDIEFWKTIWILGMKFWKSNLEYWKLNSWHATRILENSWSEITRLARHFFLALTRFSNSLDWIRFHHNCSSS